MVSVVVTTYNRNYYCKALLKSIAAQTYRNFEVIVVDDSGVRNEEIINFIQDLSEEIDIQLLLNGKNLGVQISRNRGLSRAKSEWVCFVDDDDLWCPSKLKEQVCLIDDSVSIVYSDALLIDEHGRNTGLWTTPNPIDPRREILSECFIPSPSVMVKKSVLLDVGCFDVKFVSCQDWDAWTRVILTVPCVRRVPKPLVMYRKHSGESIGSSTKAALGYRQYSRKYLFEAIRYGGIKNMALHLARGYLGVVPV